MTDVEELLAWGIHEAYRKQRVEAGDDPGSTRSLVAWPALPDDLKESSRRQARNLLEIYAELGYDVTSSRDRPSDALGEEEVERAAQLVHESWLEERVRNGWRYGPERDDEARVHPGVVPWDGLDEDVREIDRHLVRTFPAVVESTGLRLVRRS